MYPSGPANQKVQPQNIFTCYPPIKNVHQVVSTNQKCSQKVSPGSSRRSKQFVRSEVPDWSRKALNALSLTVATTSTLHHVKHGVYENHEKPNSNMKSWDNRLEVLLSLLVFHPRGIEIDYYYPGQGLCLHWNAHKTIARLLSWKICLGIGWGWIFIETRERSLIQEKIQRLTVDS